MGLLDWLFGFRPTTSTPVRDDAFAAAIVERVVDATDRRVRLESGYRRFLRPGATATLEHIRRMLRSFPGPVEVSAEAWSANRSLHAFFARPADVAIPFNRSRSVRRFFAQSMADECFALLRFRHAERDVLMKRIDEDGVQVEVIQQLVSFSEPTVLAPAADLQSAWIELGKRTVDFLAMKALDRITGIQQEKKELEEERALLKMRLQMAQAAGRGLGNRYDDSGTPPVDIAAIDRDLETNEQALERYATTGSLRPFLEELRAVLAKPEAWIRTESHPLVVDDMNVRVADDAPDAIPLTICDLYLAGYPPLASTLVRFPRSELLPESELWKAAEAL